MNDARAKVLAAVEKAVAEFDAPAPQRDYQRSLSADVDLLDLLVDRLIDYRAEVIDIRSQTGADPVRLAIEEELRVRGIETVVVSPDFPAACRPAGVRVVEDHALAPEELEAIPASLTLSSGAVALSGTIMLSHGRGEGRRIVSLLPDVHVCLVHAPSVTGTLVEALAALGPRQIMTWVSGPSATSDIELVRVEGVHGPRTLVVVLHSLDVDGTLG